MFFLRCIFKLYVSPFQFFFRKGVIAPAQPLGGIKSKSAEDQTKNSSIAELYIEAEIKIVSSSKYKSPGG
jgi:hypothetical protein